MYAKGTSTPITLRNEVFNRLVDARNNPEVPKENNQSWSSFLDWLMDYVASLEEKVNRFRDKDKNTISNKVITQLTERGKSM